MTKSSSTVPDFACVFAEDEQQQKEKEKIDDDLQQLSEGSSPEPNSNEVIIPILKKNGPILASQ
jgi:hypothetical protein